MHWTGIGTRGFLTKEVTNRQACFAKVMASHGHELWTGGAVQSDYNFLHGACSYDVGSRLNQKRQHVVRSVGMERFSRSSISRPQLHLCEEHDLLIAEKYLVEKGLVSQRFFSLVDPITRALHLRNFYQVMESPEEVRSGLVVYASKEDRWGNVSGGTRTAVNLARFNNIPNFNIKKKGEWERLVDHVESSGIVTKGVFEMLDKLKQEECKDV